MRFVLTPIGSAGDVFPFLGLAIRLRDRGHQVSMITNGHFADLITRHGIEFDAFGDEAAYQKAINNPDLFHPIKGFRTVVSFVRDQRKLMDLIRKQARGHAVIVGHTLSWAANLLEEMGELPAATIVLAPAIIRSVHLAPVMHGHHGISLLPSPAQRAVWWMVDRWIADPPVASVLDDFRRELGLPKIRRFFRDWIHSPRLTIGMFPEWFGPIQPDWPKSVRLSSFPLCDWVSGATADPELLEFVHRERPIVFTPGTGNIRGHVYFTAAAKICEELNTAGLLLTPHREQLPTRLPAHVRHHDFVSLSEILPHCRAVVHHGGIGTTAAAIAAGIPQLVMPLSHDQPDNAARVKRLNLGDSLLPRRFSERRLLNSLARILQGRTIAEQCRMRSRELAHTEGLDATCELLEPCH